MKKKTLIWANRQSIIPLLVIILVLLTALLWLGLRANRLQIENNAIINSVPEAKEDWTRVTPWPSFPETENWNTYVNENMGIMIKYPSDKIVIYQEQENGVIFTTPEWKYPTYPVIALYLEKADKISNSAKGALKRA